MTWQDSRSGYYDIYVQRVSASGSLQWPSAGVALSTATGWQEDPAIVSDGSGGAIVTWRSYVTGESSDIYARRVNASGAVQWTANGVALCTAAGAQATPALAPDGVGGAIVTWPDNRGENWDIYAQSVDSRGRPGFLGPTISAVADIPGDQGGWTRIGLEKAKMDDALEAFYPISTYNVWKRVDAAALAAAAGGGTVEATSERVPGAAGLSGWPVKELGCRRFVSSEVFAPEGGVPAGVWELIGSFAACQLDEYLYRAVTTADSTEAGIPYAVYFVSAHTTTPSVWYASDPDSGYSVDNIPPGMPAGLAAEPNFAPAGLALAWDMSPANDLSHYAVHRGSSESFVPGPENLVATPAVPEWFDGAWWWTDGYYYKVSALDVHGNESGFALLRPEDVTGALVPMPPEASYLAQNQPNPFNPMTKIAFGLSAPAHVSLRIYAVSGRLVRELVNETRPAARYEETWNGRDGAARPVASGVYFYRLEAGPFTETRKMILLQ